MNCHICMESYNIANRVPKNLSCGHTFCDRCLKKLGNGYELECPKCRQKSRNNLPICYAIYDQLLLENKAELDEPCKIHEYEKLQFYCNKDKCNICSLCLSYLHQGHMVSSIKDKIQCDENLMIINKWNNFFQYKKEEFTMKREKLSQLLKDIDQRKTALQKELNSNYDRMVENFVNSKSELLKQVEQLYMTESAFLKDLQFRIDTIINEYTSNLKKVEIVNNSLNSNSSILSINIEEYNNLENNISNTIESLMNEKSFIRFKTIKWSEDSIFSKKEIALDAVLKEEIRLKNHIILFGDYKDKIIVSFNLKTKKYIKMESTFGGDYEFLDYSCICQYKDDMLLISGGCIYSNYRNTASRSTYIVKIISPEQLTFTEFKPLMGERFSHASCVVNSIPYVFGGHNGLTTLNSIEYYDESSGSWKLLPNGMIMEREIFAYCVVRDRYIYVFGGFNDTHLDTIEKFDTLNGKWKMLSIKMKKPLQNSTAININNDHIALVGGYNGTMHKTFDIINLVSGVWTSIEGLKVARRRSHCFIFDNQIFIFGGEGTEVDQHIPEMVDLDTMSFRFIEPYDLIMSKSMNFWASTIIV